MPCPGDANVNLAMTPSDIPEPATWQEANVQLFFEDGEVKPLSESRRETMMKTQRRFISEPTGRPAVRRSIGKRKSEGEGGRGRGSGTGKGFASTLKTATCVVNKEADNDAGAQPLCNGNLKSPGGNDQSSPRGTISVFPVSSNQAKGGGGASGVARPRVSFGGGGGAPGGIARRRSRGKLSLSFQETPKMPNPIDEFFNWDFGDSHLYMLKKLFHAHYQFGCINGEPYLLRPIRWVPFLDVSKHLHKRCSVSAGCAY